MKGDMLFLAVPFYVKTGAVFVFKRGFMNTRVAVISIIIEDTTSVEKLNTILHENGKYIIGRMGLPYHKRNMNIICIAIDAPQDTIAALSGKIGKLAGVTVKTAYSKVTGDEQ